MYKIRNNLIYTSHVAMMGHHKLYHVPRLAREPTSHLLQQTAPITFPPQYASNLRSRCEPHMPRVHQRQSYISCKTGKREINGIDSLSLPENSNPISNPTSHAFYYRFQSLSPFFFFFFSSVFSLSHSQSSLSFHNRFLSLETPSFSLYKLLMAGNDWINSYLEAILDVGPGIDDAKSSSLLLRERGRFSPTRYFVEEVITGFDETDLHRSWVRVRWHNPDPLILV